MKIIRKYLITNCKFWKLKSSTPYKDELTVFIKVKTEILKEFSKEIPKNVKNDERNKVDIIKIITDKKYLLISDWFKFLSEKVSLLAKTCLGLAWERSSFKEYLINECIFINLIPELVEKKEPPIITSIKKIK